MNSSSKSKLLRPVHLRHLMSPLSVPVLTTVVSSPETNGSKMDIDSLAVRVMIQADRLFPARTDSSMFLKLYGEIGEMVDSDPENLGGEVADVFIMLLDFAKRKGINISKEVVKKMAINDLRQWQADQNGVFKHV